MKNLDLLEKHRRKVAFILAGLIMWLIYISIISFELILIYLGKSTFNDFIIFWVWLIILIPFVYSLLSYMSCRVMHKVYSPLRESVTNLENFTSNVNHEFKTSLSEIISSLELWEITNSRRDYTPQALSSAKRLDIILESLTPLVEYSNASYRRKNTDIAKLFYETIEEYMTAIESKNLDIVSDIPTSLYIYIDSGPLIICFSNILSNAIKYSKEGWKIEISLTKESFNIKDNGIWIKSENIEKIFERNYRESSDNKWLGIWLSLVKRICDIYGWQIDIESKKDTFTEVTIRL